MKTKILTSKCIFCGKTVESDETLCNNCIAAVKGRFEDSGTTTDTNRGGSIREGYIRLFEAVRMQAIEDKKLNDFETYWIKSAQWKPLWEAVEESFLQRREIANGVETYLGSL